MAKFVMEIEFSEKVANDLHAYFQETTLGKLGFFEVLEENVQDLVRSMDPQGSAKIVEVIYDGKDA